MEDDRIIGLEIARSVFQVYGIDAAAKVAITTKNHHAIRKNRVMMN